jgi:hypothetical protein
MRSADRVRKCLLLGAERTQAGHHETDAFDPKRSLGAPVDVPVAYLIAAKASTCSRKSGLDNCGVEFVSITNGCFVRLTQADMIEGDTQGLEPRLA